MTAANLQHRIQTCRQRYEAAPESRAFAPLADVLRLAGRHAEALELLEDGLIRHPEFQAAMVILGYTLLDADRSEHARKVLHRVLERDNENLVVLRLLTEDSRSRQAWDEAVPLLEQLAKHDPDDERWPRALSEARANRNVPDPSDVPETSFATLTLVDIYLAQGYRAKAMTALRQMQEREPDRRDIQDRIAEIGILEGSLVPGSEQSGLTTEWEGEAGGLGLHRQQVAAKRAQEKKNFSSWIHRIRDDESPLP